MHLVSESGALIADTVVAVMRKYRDETDEGKRGSLRDILAANEYVRDQWLTPPFDKWTILSHPAGLPMTNNAHESMNKALKILLGRRRGPLVSFLDVAARFISDHVEHPPSAERASYHADTVDKKRVCEVLNAEEAINKSGEDSYEIAAGVARDDVDDGTDHNDGEAWVLAREPSNDIWQCTCPYFWKWGQCKHTQAVEVLEKRREDPRAVLAPRVGRPKKIRKLEHNQCVLSHGASQAD
eukprot:TRINITY_DN5187_c0_g1_i4.p2 TRINITY_DN5187_c0_g1~~TRINITY_DN5187_c0_g1_i4.p2  ORF type:complete len:240 (+),score=37.81 TRINITY_DN5187_c0_g1_i4:485-1204(+)